MPLPVLTDTLENLAAGDRPPVAAARQLWTRYRLQNGRRAGGPYLSAPDANAKTNKTHRPTYTLQLAPAASSRIIDVCGTSGSCASVCVGGNTCGRAKFDPGIMDGRTLRTRFLAEYPAAALALIAAELKSATYKRDSSGRVTGRRRIAARLNAYSDVRWEYAAPDLLEIPFVDPYDYTKHDPADRAPCGRYRLMYSIDERDGLADIERKAAAGPIVVVFAIGKNDPRPDRWHRWPVVDGDADDYRNALHPAGTVVGLYVKGTAAARAIGSGFARDPWTPPPVDAPRPRPRRWSPVEIRR